MTDRISKKEEAAAARVAELLSRPVPDDPDMLGIEGQFDPWDLFPALLGSYSEAFDDCAIEVLEDLRDGAFNRSDLASEMFREMLCTSDLCDYGTSPRTCFPTQPFKQLLPQLIEKCREFRRIAWTDEPKE